MMAYALLDDGLLDNPKVKPLTDSAWRLYVSTIIYSTRNLTDGRIDPRTAHELSLGKKKLIAELVAADLLHENGSGYVIHDFHEHNPPAEEVRKKRRIAAERMRQLRANADRKS